MITKALIKTDARFGIRVAPWTSALITIFYAEWCTIVTGRHDSVIVHDDAAYSSLHAVGARRGNMSNAHEVGVPSWPQQLIIAEVMVC